MMFVRSILCFSPFVARAAASVQQPMIAMDYATAATNLPRGEILGNTSADLAFESGGKNRTYTIYVPKSYTSTHASPLMLSFHGNGGTSQKQQRITSFSDPAINPDTIVVYPQGYDKHWQGAPYSTEGVDDVSFALELVDYISGTHHIDPSRIYASGMSNGGGFVGTLACDAAASKRFAAFAAHSGAFYPTNKTCVPERAIVPFLEIHGDSDEIMKYGGGVWRKVKTPDIMEYVSRWARHAKLDMQPLETELGDHVQFEYAKKSGSMRGVVAHVKVHGLGHDWAVDVDGFSSSPYILSWLRKWPLKQV